MDIFSDSAAEWSEPQSGLCETFVPFEVLSEDSECGLSQVSIDMMCCQQQQQQQAGRIWILLILSLVFISNQACRSLMFYLVDFGGNADTFRAMNVALDFDSAQYGMVATVAFTVPFTFTSFMAGVAADTFNRVNLNTYAGIAWSVSILLLVWASNYWEVVASRLLLGFAQAFTNPAALSLLAQLFPESRATISSIFNLGIYIGAALGSLAAAMNRDLGWRACCLGYGVGSIVVCTLCKLASDPRPPLLENNARLVESREASEEEQGCCRWILSKASRAVHHLVAQVAEVTTSKQVCWLYLAATLRFCAGFGILVWLPPAMASRFPDSLGSFGLANSMIKAFAGSCSSLAGGIIADHLRSTGRGNGGYFCACASFLAAPLWWFTLQPGCSFKVSMAFLLLEYLAAESWMGPCLATLQGAVPQERCGAAQGVFSSLTALGNFLPMALGFVPDTQLIFALQVSVSGCYLLSAVCFLMVASFPAPAVTAAESQRRLRDDSPVASQMTADVVLEEDACAPSSTSSDIRRVRSRH